MSNLGYIQMSLKDPLLSVSLFCHLASIILCALIISETLALYKSFTYLLTYRGTVAVQGKLISQPAKGADLRTCLDGVHLDLTDTHG